MKYSSWLVVILLLLPISALAVFRPVRVLIPEAFGVYCNKQNLCVEDLSRLAAAESLLNDSKSYLATQWGLSIGEPKIIFCSTEQCRSAFGLSNKAGFTLGSFAIAIAPRAWQPHYVAHELIHHWQADQFGSLALLTSEHWLIEGMAYALSNDPRVALHEPFETYRQRFNGWYRLNADIPLKESLAGVL
ncbi:MULTISPECIES: hypothetical protein [Methylomonas]|uniref:Uncharacterized protein n=2 Tax=Methylomonas TaxID=416 RepID=A0A140E5V4_9GAMM|nr:MULTISPECIES: hypothetical protein [Methylomonas]AMK78778.1 hypothetical protein JT25_020175 [Methylomonas denitrificans]OAI08400.1 hypothetical protein A1342_10980 [Methylomonas methanica]TCV83467.1 hypothetical protein EDE11_10923 [Methylomonas methanica]